MNKLQKTLNITLIGATLLIPISTDALPTNGNNFEKSEYGLNYFSLSKVKIGENDYNSLYDAVEAAETGDTIELLNDLEENQIIEIKKGITINGNGHKITSNNLSSSTAVFLISTSEETVINDIIIETNARGITIDSKVHNFTINNSTLNVGLRGISIASDDNQDSILNVNDCLIQNNNVSNYDEEVPNNDSRGISLWQYSNSEISIKNTTIQGFSYVINITSNYTYDSSDTKLLLENCILKGRAGINDSLTKGLEIEIKDSEILGINNQSGSQEEFGDIVIFSNSTVKLYIENTKLSNYQNEVGLNNEKALQYMLDIRTGGNIIRLSGNSFGIDTTDKLKSIFRFIGIPASNTEENDIEIIGGTYDYDVSEFIPADYTLVNENGTFTVLPKVKNIEIAEQLELTTKETSQLTVTLIPENSVGILNYSSSDDSVLEIDSDGKILAKKPGVATIIVTAEGIQKTCQVTVAEKEITFNLPELNTESQTFGIGLFQEDKTSISEVLKETLNISTIFEEITNLKKEGAEISVDINLSEMTNDQILDSEKEIINATINKGHIVKYFDISLAINADSNKIGQLTELTKDIAFAIKMPTELLQEDREFYILRIHNGEVEKIKGNLDGELFTFRTDKFSTYALVYVNTPKESGTTYGPQTGDMTGIIYASIAALSAFGLITTRKKKNR